MKKNHHTLDLFNNITSFSLCNSILDGSRNIIIFLSRKLEIIDCNQLAINLYNWNRSYILKKNYLKLCKDKNTSPALQESFLKKALLGKRFFNIPNIVFNKKLGTSYIIWNSIPIKDKKHKVKGIILLGEDITKLKHIKVQEQTIRGHFENIIAHIPGFIFWKDKNLKIIGCNENFAKIAGETTTSIIGKSDFQLPWKRSESSRFRRDDQEVIASGKAKLNIEEPVRQIDGSEKFLLTNKVPLRDAAKNIIGVIGIFNDITYRKKVELELYQAKEKAELAHTATRIFTESMSHELRTPLASISGYTYGIKKYLPILLEGYQLAKRHNLNVTPFRQNHYDSIFNIVTNIETEINHSNAIIDMTLFRANPNKLKKSNLTECSIKQIIEQTLVFYPFKSSNELSLINWKDVKDFIFLGEQLFTIHILLNLLKNALYYIAQTGKAQISIWSERRKNYNILHFKDTSKGISPAILPKIFDLYFSDTPHGTGVGLAFCKQVMEIFSGDIECRSEEGVYTEFILKFPILKNKKIQ